VQVILRAIEDFIGQKGARYDPRHRHGPDHRGEGDDRITSCLGSGPTVSESDEQLFQNLLGNAIKYMDKPQGRIRVRCDARNGNWEFAVADNGPGIEAKYFEKVFQLFQTLAPRDEVEGTGVGLALAKKIVESEGGRVWIESTPGAGATFRFTLPRS